MNTLWEGLTHPPLNLPLLWLIFFMVMAVAEMLTPFFGLILVGASGLVGGFLAWRGYEFHVQVIGFAVTCFLSLVLLRPRIVERLHSKAHVPQERTGYLIGKTGEVTQSIGPSQQGRVTINGEDWAAESKVHLPEGTQVRVVGADGIVLKVDKVG